MNDSLYGDARTTCVTAANTSVAVAGRGEVVKEPKNWLVEPKVFIPVIATLAGSEDIKCFRSTLKGSMICRFKTIHDTDGVDRRPKLKGSGAAMISDVSLLLFQ